ncbi:hypothetical protein ACHQM5_004846 [Ranunculus cassubicifolius]
MTYLTRCKCKSRWPGMLGVEGNHAAATIERENPAVNVVILLEGTGGTPSEYRCDRVKVWVDVQGTVVRVPQVG